MRTTDWKFDFSSLPHWDVRDRIPYIYDDFLEIPQSDTLCCIYSVCEASMCNYIGFLAILRNKNAPELFLNIADRFNFCDNISVSTDGNLIFLQPSVYNEAKNTVRRPVLIIDIGKGAFAYFDTDNHNPDYKVIEVGGGIFKIEVHPSQLSDKRLAALSKKKIYTDRLRWRDLGELPSLPDLLF